MNKNKQLGASMVATTSIIVVIVLVVAGIVIFSANRESPTEDTGANQVDSPVNITDFEATPTEEGGGEPGTEGEGKIAISQIFTVTYTDEGYSPRTITIKLGDTVEFLNESSGKFWPASAVHPTHEIYPEFDPKRELGAGETYSPTFSRAGTWNYHDHLKPSQKGTIIVQE